MCMGGGDSEWTHYDISRVRARKEHVCSECKRTISPGEEYHRHVGFMRGESPSTWVKCAQCEAAIDWLGKVCDGYLHEMCLEDLREHLREHRPIRSLSLARLVRGMERQWRFHGDPLTPVATVTRWVETGYAPIAAELRAENERRMAEFTARRERENATLAAKGLNPDEWPF